MGISRSSWYRAINSEKFELLYPGVARLWGSPATLHQRALAAVWAVGGNAVTSHRTSASLWGVDRPSDDPIDIILPSRSRHALPAAVVVHRPRDLRDLRPIVRFQVPTTSPLRMLLDLGAVDPDGVEPAMIAILSGKIASPAAIRNTLFRHAKQGRHGVTALRLALEAWLGEELPPDSELEAAMHAMLAAQRLPPVQFHAVVATYEVDFYVLGSNIVIECDGWESHGLNRDQFEFDRIRNAELTAAGYVIVHITWRRLKNSPEQVAKQIRDNIERWAPQLLRSGR